MGVIFNLSIHATFSSPCYPTMHLCVLHGRRTHGVYSIIILGERYGRKLKTEKKKSYDPSEDAVFLKGLRMVSLFCGRAYRLQRERKQTRTEINPGVHLV